MRFTKHLLLPACMAFAALGNASATALLYSDFSSVAGLQLNGNAAQAGNVLRLTPALSGQSGSAFSTTAISLASDASFSSAFTFRITNSGGIGDEDGAGADGLVFVVQTVSNTAGGAGGGIGYQGLAKSLGVEFDTYNNGGGDGSNGNHVGIDLAGSVNSAARANIATRMNNGSIWSVWVDYNGVTDLLEVRLLEGTGSRPGAATLSYTVDLPGQLTTTDAFVGFTSGTGSGWGNHDILAWQFNSSYDPIGDIGGDVPEPASLALLGMGLGALGLTRKRKQQR